MSGLPFSTAILLILSGTMALRKASAQHLIHLVDATDGRVISGGQLRVADGAHVPCDDRGACAWEGVPAGPVRIEAAGYVPRTIQAAHWMRTDTVHLLPLQVELPVFEVALRHGDQAHGFSAVADVDSTLLASNERSGLRGAVAWVPGVQWDQRGFGGSQRLGIRGGILRSPFGVRGVKVYWGPFPITLADGSTPLEMLDPRLVHRLRVMRSVAAPAFGPAPGGLLLADPPLSTPTPVVAEGEFSAGPNGFFRMAVDAGLATEGEQLRIGVLRQGNDGFREQEWNHRDQAWLSMRRTSTRGATQVQATWQDARWALPGSVDSLTAINDPRAARPYSRLLDAHVDKRQWMAGIAQEHRFSPRLHSSVSLHGQGIDKVNPYGTSPTNNGWKEERIVATGTRLLLGGSMGRDDRVRWDAGIEALLQRDALREYPYVDALRGPLRVDATTHVGTVDGFLQMRGRLGEGTWVHGGLGFQSSRYNHLDRILDRVTQGVAAASWSPMAGLSQRIVRGWSMHVRYAESLDRPTVWELLGAPGIFNDSLAAASVREMEAGIALASPGAGLSADLRIYRRWNEDLIVPVMHDDGSTTHRNAGRALQDGIELLARWEAAPHTAWRPFALLSLSWQNGWLHPVDDGHTRALPGEPPLRTGLLIGLRHRNGTFVEYGTRHTYAMAVSTTFSDRLPGHVWMQVRVGQRIQAYRLSMDLFATVDNLLDVRYTAFAQVNDPGRRYYNPAPGRGLFGGLVLRWG